MEKPSTSALSVSNIPTFPHPEDVFARTRTLWVQYGAWEETLSHVIAAPTMSYDRKPVDDEIESYLRSIDHSAKARGIAEAIDYHPSYLGSVVV
jgi:hypothetical protein